MVSALTGEEIPDAVLIGERHDKALAKQHVRGRLQAWFDEGYTRFGIEKPGDHVIPEEAFEVPRPQDLQRVSSGAGNKQYWGFYVRDVIRKAEGDSEFRHGEFPEVLSLFAWLTDVIVEALDIGYTVECLDTIEAVGAASNKRVQAMDNVAIGVIGAGVKGFVALVGDEHLVGIGAGLEAQGWSWESEIVEEDEEGEEGEEGEESPFADLKGLLTGLNFEAALPTAEVSEGSESES
jgi:hypothetical protein